MIIHLLTFIFFFVVNSALCWSPYHDPYMLPNRSVIVQMFEWRFDDVADECERFLGPMGYGGVQISPPVNEHALMDRPWFNKDVRFPWYQRYQAVSYKLVSRSGDKEALKSMIARCNKAGVRVYIDIVLNHMTGSLNSGAFGSAGSFYDSDNFNYTAVPFNRSHFNSKEKCRSSDGGIHDFEDRWESRNCELVGLHDLDQSQKYVQVKLAEHLNELIELGIAGFRADATKHIWPEDLTSIFSLLKPLNEDIYGKDKKPFVYHEVGVIVNRDPKPNEILPTEYTDLGRLVNFRYIYEMQAYLSRDGTAKLKDMRNMFLNKYALKSEDSVTVIDNHDRQRAPDHIMSFKNKTLHLKANALMLAWPYGIPKIMASYRWPEKIVNGEDVNVWYGPPHEADFTTKHVTVNADGESCGDDWVCEHRWRQTYGLVQFRNAVDGAPVTHWWDNGDQAIAFGRKGRGFFVLNNEDVTLSVELQTDLPQGVYCDVVTGHSKNNRCTGQYVYVDSKGKTHVTVSSGEGSFLAIHINARAYV